MSDFRRIELPGCVNLRNVGGCATRSRMMLARGRLFRGGELSGVQPTVLAELVEVVGLRRVIDLRTAGECSDADGLDLPPVCERVHLPLLPVIRPHWADPADRTPPATARRYLEMVEEGRAPLARLLPLLTDLPRRPTLIHCVAGRDRTGIVIACLLDLLEVPDETIAADYALSDGVEGGDGGTANPDNILLLLELLRETYGSTRNMLLHGGVPSRVIDRFRSALLIS